MRFRLFDFQEDALYLLRKRLNTMRPHASPENPQVISFSAPTGAGKTIVMTALFESIFFGTPDFEAQPDAVILWVSDSPELNEQTRMKIERASNRIRSRQLHPIESSFDSHRLHGGNIYFINTQKLGTDKLLTRKGDSRQFTIWETFSNTAQITPDRFYVVIDEAHRGARTKHGGQSPETIMQSFLFGAEEIGLSRMPLVLGISATPDRFERLLSLSQSHTIARLQIPIDDVRESGLLKDRIIMHHPDNASQTEMSLLSAAAQRWDTMRRQWADYCSNEDEEPVLPILVVQVEDGTGQTISRTRLDEVISTIENAIGRQLGDDEVTHTFTATGDQVLGGRRVRYIEPSRIQDDNRVSVVLFKMSLSTGWDCPRAEVMMSFRKAQDHTYIAQLLGRMVRTPLARRVESVAALNDVHLYLPYFNEDSLNEILAALQNVENVPPSDTGSGREMVTLIRSSQTEAIFDTISVRLVTFRVGAFRKQSALRRLLGLGRALTRDGIEESAHASITKLLVDEIHDEIIQMHESGSFDQKAKGITDVQIKSLIHLYGGDQLSPGNVYRIRTAAEDIERHFDHAGRVLGGLHLAYWKTFADERDANEIKVELAVLVGNHDALARLERKAQSAFNALYEKHRSDIAQLNEKKRTHYESLRLAATDPESIPWNLPDSIPFRRSPDSPIFEKHLYTEQSGAFRADLGPWELGVLEEELTDPNVIGWLRNVDRQPWALQIPYRDGAGVPRPMYPDLVIVRNVDGRMLFDILEPHRPDLDDNYLKAVGLAEFADRYMGLFDRIELIRKGRGPGGQELYYRLNLALPHIATEARAFTSNQQLNAAFSQYATAQSGHAITG